MLNRRFILVVTACSLLITACPTPNSTGSSPSSSTGSSPSNATGANPPTPAPADVPTSAAPEPTDVEAELEAARALAQKPAEELMAELERLSDGERAKRSMYVSFLDARESLNA